MCTVRALFFSKLLLPMMFGLAHAEIRGDLVATLQQFPLTLKLPPWHTQGAYSQKWFRKLFCWIFIRWARFGRFYDSPIHADQRGIFIDSLADDDPIGEVGLIVLLSFGVFKFWLALIFHYFPSPMKRKLRKHFNKNSLIQTVRSCFEQMYLYENPIWHDPLVP